MNKPEKGFTHIVSSAKQKAQVAEEETQTFCEWICIKSYGSLVMHYGRGYEVPHVAGSVYYFHEDSPANSEYFLPVIDSEGFPVTKTCRVDR